MIPNKNWKIVRASSESRFNGKLAKHSIDGDPRTLWHTQWRGKLLKHPHELVIDLGDEYSISGFRYLPRQIGGWNGTLKKCEFYVSDSPNSFGEPAAEALFKKSRQAQEVKCTPVRGRYIMLRTLSEQSDGPWASVAELGVVGGK